jgi:DNA mismatch repair protein MutS2
MELATSLLELDEIQGALRQRVRTALGVRAVGTLAPLPRREEAHDQILTVHEARALIESSETAPVFTGDEVEGFVTLAEKGMRLEGAQLRSVASTVLSAQDLRRHLSSREQQVPRLYGLGVSIPDLLRPAQDIRRCFDPDGQLSDDASADLGPLRRKVRSLRDAIHDKIHELLSHPSIEPYLQERYFTIRGDRHVLPVVASYKNHVPGIVHDASGSGQTVYIEPQALVDLGNRLKIAQSEQQEEEDRILSRLSVVVADHGAGIRTCCRVLGRVDLLNAAARLAIDLDASPVLPDAEPGFWLLGARHPLLVLQSITPEVPAPGEEEAPPSTEVDKDHPRFEVVPNDLGLDSEQQILVLTGPNTGGKTVAMKTVGLLALMSRCGLPIPCAPTSRIGWYAPIVGTIGDQQSIATNLSTFAAHMKALLSVLDSSRPGTLVLIDEIAADTDPLQGQAIAQAVLEQVADRGAHAVVTTHFERLKAVPFQDPRFRNAGVGFDERALRPTYRVTLDVPQGSSALDIASGLGLPGAVVERARDLLGSGAGSLESLIRSVELRAQELEEAREREEAARRELERDRAELQRQQARLQAEIERVRERARTELLDEIERARAEAKTMVAELQRAAQASAPADAMRVANRVSDQLRTLHEEEAAKHTPDPGPDPRAPLEEVAVGDWVHVPKLGRDGEVLTLDGRDAQVAVGTIKMRVAVKSLRAAQTARPTKSTPPRSGPKPKPSLAPQPLAAPDAPDEIDLRGQSVDESIDRLETFLDYHYGQPTKRVRIIHGHGTGALREAVREHLHRSGYVKSIRPGEQDEGGDGVTVVSLH